MTLFKKVDRYAYKMRVEYGTEKHKDSIKILVIK